MKDQTLAEQISEELQRISRGAPGYPFVHHTHPDDLPGWIRLSDGSVCVLCDPGEVLELLREVPDDAPVGQWPDAQAGTVWRAVFESLLRQTCFSEEQIKASGHVTVTVEQTPAGPRRILTRMDP